jgi:hypothetical protein
MLGLPLAVVSWKLISANSDDLLWHKKTHEHNEIGQTLA